MCDRRNSAARWHPSKCESKSKSQSKSKGKSKSKSKSKSESESESMCMSKSESKSENESMSKSEQEHASVAREGAEQTQEPCSLPPAERAQPHPSAKEPRDGAGARAQERRCIRVTQRHRQSRLCGVLAVTHAARVTGAGCGGDTWLRRRRGRCSCVWMSRQDTIEQ